MAISLDGIDLPDLIREGEFDWTGVEGASETTLGGRPVVWESALQAGRPVDLVALEDQGWLTRAQVRALVERAAQPGWTGVLDYEGERMRVRFRNEEPPAVDVRPLIPRPNHADTDYYIGRIRLMEV